MDIAATRSPATLGAGTQTKAPIKELGKDEFLRLLTTQLANQDPLSPMDNQQFIAQLAQFASVEQLHGLGDRLDTLLLAQASSNQMNVAGLVGKEITYASNGVDLAAGGTASMRATLSQAANVTVAIRDAAGRTVRTMPLGQRPAGALDVAWDGLDAKGSPLPAGRYTIEVSGLTSDGTRISGVTQAKGLATGVAFDAEDGPRLLVNGSRVKLSDILQIDQPTTPA